MKPLSNPYLATLLISLTAQAAWADQLLDPTRPANARSSVSTQTVAPLRVEAILRSDERHLAIVNGKVVQAGDQVGTARIDEVLTDGVRYTRAGQTHIVRLEDRSMRVRKNVAQYEE
jgi:hypothetical protein